ncbi:methyltransferase domain-containing protein [Telmatospirillum sp.]|uniref:methyltransferase domain-containing protein n=1 Tax=Telmatospirillum sp. TaxID=2079197 RepID=UPI0028458BFA|nr:methyltransferase domain-containing protein [Telmatospirillum sp.]MDR3435024.1 methyltransferase domain-containing protein [Telmatospirillum sp.]
MNNQKRSDHPHSSEYFGEERDFWWNDDFLDLIGQRVRLGEIGRIADIGCGLGHWSALIYRRLAKDAELIGIDRDRDNIAGAVDRIARLMPGGRFNFMQGDAMALPLSDNAVQAATCQTLLMHLANPAGAIAEMIRVTQPGGLILAVEPNNTFNRMGMSSLSVEAPVDDIVRGAELALRYAIGRMKKGLGCEFIGDLLPGMFEQAGLQNIEVWLSDKVVPSLPPYDEPGQQAQLAAIERWQAEGSGPFDWPTMADNIRAGGGDEALLRAGWDDINRDTAAMFDGIRNGCYHATNGGLFYIIAGRVPNKKSME